jgi:hypothetical protein
MKHVLRSWHLIAWAIHAGGLTWVLVFERSNAKAREWLIALTISACVFFLFTLVAGLRSHQQREHEMDIIDDLMRSKNKQPFDKGD